MMTKIYATLCCTLLMSVLTAGLAFSFPKQGAMPVAQGAPSQTPISGTVAETMDAGGYSYLLLDDKQNKTWVAVPVMKVAVGDEISVQPGNEMGPFTSKSLGRTFDKIIFSAGLIAAPKSAAMPPNHPAVPAADAKVPAGHPALPDAETVAQAKHPAQALVKTSGTVVETFNSGGYTYIQLEKDGHKSWAAVPPVEVKVGSEVAVRPGVEMGQFTSKTLNRTFEGIVFSPGLVTN